MNERVVIQFIEQQLITSFGMPSILVFYNAAYFYSTLLTKFALDKGIIIRYSTNYYPQGNGVAESTNKNLVRILKKTITDNQRNWHSLIHNALWVDRVTPKDGTRRNANAARAQTLAATALIFVCRGAELRL
jgi:transposase InsO family protein